jgi:FkbM family methyltransferase
MADTVAEHVKNVGDQDLLPYDHKLYLAGLKAKGFEPKVIYDIGACVLHWTKVAQRLWPNAKIILFDAFNHAEPLWKGFDYHLGVLSNPGRGVVKFYQNDMMFGGNSYYREVGNVFPEDNYISYPTKSLDEVVKERNFPLPDLIKIDVQGAEKDILEGASYSLTNCKHLIVEIQHQIYNEGAPTVVHTLPYIESLGYKCVAPLFSNNGPDGDYGFEKVI